MAEACHDVHATPADWPSSFTHPSLQAPACQPWLFCAHSFLDSVGCVNTKILAKIETRQALLNFPGILSEADGVIISRGELKDVRVMCCRHQTAWQGIGVLHRSSSQLLYCSGSLHKHQHIFLLRASCAGNLGLDCVPEKMALIQKTLIQVNVLSSLAPQPAHLLHVPCWSMRMIHACVVLHH